MKKLIVKLSVVLALAAMVAVLASCTVPIQKVGPDGKPYVEHQVDPQLRGVLDTVGTVGGVLPPPWGWIIGSSAAAVGAVAQTIAKNRTKKSANKWEEVATTVIEGVEAAGVAAAEVKKSIAQTAKDKGNGLLIDEVVQTKTA